MIGFPYSKPSEEPGNPYFLIIISKSQCLIGLKHWLFGIEAIISYKLQ
jgi:hypothetical protein